MSAERVEAWFGRRGWSPLGFQRETWNAYLAGWSGLVHSPTGTGKTMALLMGPVLEYLEAEPDARRNEPVTNRGRGRNTWIEAGGRLRLLWVTPMRALANDTTRTIVDVVRELDLPWNVELRTGDSAANLKLKHRERLPTVLVTTPESLTLMLSYPESSALMGDVRCIVMDEWHELMGSKRGVQAQLAAACVSGLGGGTRIWGVSATIGNLLEAMDVLLGKMVPDDRRRIVHGRMLKEVRVESLLPTEVERFPWAGHLGTRMLGPVIEAIGRAKTTLVFTNTRSQAEIWFAQILKTKGEWVGEVALHHGSLDRALRERIEGLLRSGKLRCVVCTSSLDLGVDFSPVEQVIQIGSPRGIARLLQRAGRSGHQVGAVSRVLCVPTNAMELLDISAARRAAAGRRIERRGVVRKPMDVLVQHLVTLASGSGFDEERLRTEIRRTHAFADLTDEEWAWAMGFVSGGGPALRTYPEYRRIKREEGVWRSAGSDVTRMHRANIGTIMADGSVRVQFGNGKALGTVEEQFIARVPRGGVFVFGGRQLELVRVQELTATVKTTRKKSGMIVRWGGSRMQLSTELAEGVRKRLSEAARGVFEDAEMQLAGPLLGVQAGWSAIPREGELLVEQVLIDDVRHSFVFTFEGRAVNEGISALAAFRLMQRAAGTVLVSSNDYGFELAVLRGERLDETVWRELLRVKGLLDDMLSAVNTSTLARRAFREIARVAGLVAQGFGARRKGARQLQASSGMFYDVFRDFDPGNLLLAQAQREVLEGELDFARMRGTLERLAGSRMLMTSPVNLTPLAFPIWAESLRSHEMSNERWSDRVKRMVYVLEEQVDDEQDRPRTRAAVGGGRMGRRGVTPAGGGGGMVGANANTPGR